MNELKVGDIITAYHAGYHKIVGFSKSSAYGDITYDLVEYVKIADSNGKKQNGKEKNKCNIFYCTLVTPQKLDREEFEEYKEIGRKYNSIRKLLGIKDV